MAYAAFWDFCQAQKKAQAAAQSGQGGTPTAPPVANGCPAPPEVVKIEDAVHTKVHVGGPLHAPGTKLTPTKRPVRTDPQPVITPSRAVLCGERESSLPPRYRFRETPAPVEPANDSPAVVPTKPISDDSALEALSAGFTSSAPSAPSAPAEEPGSVPLDALNALSDILGEPEPVPEPPKIDPADIITPVPTVAEEAELVGERDDTLPPDYRFPQNGTDLHPAEEEEKPSMDSGTALDILAGDFMTGPAAVPAAAPKQPSLEALDLLDGDFVTPAQAEEEVPTDTPAGQTSSEEQVSVISCATIPTDIPAPALVEDAPGIPDLSGSMVEAQS